MKFGPFGRRLLVVLAGSLANATVQAQIPQQQDHRGAPRGMRQVAPPQIVDVPVDQPAPVVPDTVRIRISVPDSLPQPATVYVVQDTLVFGGLLHLVLEYPADQIDSPALRPESDGQWLVPYEAPQRGFFTRLLKPQAEPVLDLSSLPAVDGLRVIRSFRVYRRDPLQISWQDYLSPVLMVAGQTAGANNTATIRTPRSLVWTPWRLMGLVALLMLLSFLVYWLWRRRNRPVPLDHWTLPAAAWMATATSLQGLLAENILARGDTRLFLDRLAFLARDYVAGRYRIAAREMTGPEIVAACRGLGHDTAHPAGFARLIDLADRERYNPTAPEPAFCREQTVQFLGRIGRVRLENPYIPVSPEKLLAAQKAWAALATELGTGAGRAVRTVETGEVG